MFPASPFSIQHQYGYQEQATIPFLVLRTAGSVTCFLLMAATHCACQGSKEREDKTQLNHISLLIYSL